MARRFHDSEVVAQAQRLRRKGVTLAAIAKQLGVPRSTLHAWIYEGAAEQQRIRNKNGGWNVSQAERDAAREVPPNHVVWLVPYNGGFSTAERTHKAVTLPRLKCLEA